MTHGSVAKKVREHKEKNPHLYCPKCLWRTGGGPCKRHGAVAVKPVSAWDGSIAKSLDEETL